FLDGLMIKASGALVICDAGSQMLRELSADGEEVSSIYLTQTEPYTQLIHPSGVVMDHDGGLIIADRAQSVLYKADSENKISLYVGKLPVRGFADGDLRASKFSEASGLTLDKEGNLYVADSADSVIRKVSPSGQVTTLA